MIKIISSKAFSILQFLSLEYFANVVFNCSNIVLSEIVNALKSKRERLFFFSILCLFLAGNVPAPCVLVAQFHCRSLSAGLSRLANGCALLLRVGERLTQCSPTDTLFQVSVPKSWVFFFGCKEDFLPPPAKAFVEPKLFLSCNKNFLISKKRINLKKYELRRIS